MTKHFLFFIFFSLLFSNSSSQINRIIKKTNKQYMLVNNFETTMNVSLNVPGFRMPKKSYKVYYKLPNKIKICGPNLPSSGTICIAQVLKIIDHIKKNKKIELSDILNTLDFVYYLRERFLADDKFVRVNIDEITNIDFLIEGFLKYKTEKKSFLAEEILNSTSHFSVVDKFENVVSVTSSIESTFGSRLFVNGFFLNNQLTDFSFKSTDKNNELIKNRVQGGKKPLSSM